MVTFWAWVEDPLSVVDGVYVFLDIVHPGESLATNLAAVGFAQTAVDLHVKFQLLSTLENLETLLALKRFQWLIRISGSSPFLRALLLSLF